MDNQTSNVRGLEQLDDIVSKTAKYGTSIEQQLTNIINYGGGADVKVLAKVYNISYTALGLAGEAGEVADKVKKILRDDSGVLSEEKRQDLAKELGDVLWYAAAFAKEIGFTLEEIIQINHDKLSSRLERGKISGSGDDR